MHRNLAETVLGAAVLLTAAGFLFYFSQNISHAPDDGYTLSAAFTKTDGIETGTAVRVSGIPVGKITAMRLNPETYQAEVVMTIENSVKLPRDTAAVVASAGMLDGKFISLEPGADEDLLVDGDRLEYTQSPPGLEQLLGQVIFSLNKESKKEDGTKSDSAPASVPATPAAPASVGGEAPAESTDTP